MSGAYNQPAGKRDIPSNTFERNPGTRNNTSFVSGTDRNLYAIDATQTITWSAANALVPGGRLHVTNAVGAITLTAAVGTQIIAENRMKIGDHFFVEVHNSGNQTCTLTASTGSVITSGGTIATVVCRRFRVTCTSASAVEFTAAGAYGPAGAIV